MIKYKIKNLTNLLRKSFYINFYIKSPDFV